MKPRGGSRPVVRSDDRRLQNTGGSRPSPRADNKRLRGKPPKDAVASIRDALTVLGRRIAHARERGALSAGDWQELHDEAERIVATITPPERGNTEE